MNSIRMRTMFSTKVYNLLFIFHNYKKTELKTGHVFETYTIYYICTYVYEYPCVMRTWIYVHPIDSCEKNVIVSEVYVD